MENVLVAVFRVESEAFQAFSELKQFAQSEDIKLAQISIVKAEDGVIKVKDNFDFMNSLGSDYFKGGLIGSLIGILGGPLGVLFGFAAGGTIGVSIGSDKESTDAAIIATVSENLVNDEVAIIALVQEKDELVLNSLLDNYQVSILRWDIATVSAELESALELQKDLAHQTKARLIADKKEARHERLESIKKTIKEKFSSQK